MTAHTIDWRALDLARYDSGRDFWSAGLRLRSAGWGIVSSAGSAARAGPCRSRGFRKACMHGCSGRAARATAAGTVQPGYFRAVAGARRGPSRVSQRGRGPEIDQPGPSGVAGAVLPHAEDKPPDVVWEFGAPLTIKGDAGQKKETHRRMGVFEYWLADPVGGVYEPPVQGFELADGVYEPMPWEAGPDGLVAVWSPVLQLELRFAHGRLGFWGRETARYLELPEEESERLPPEERRGRLEERQAWQRTEREIEEVKRARKALKERIAAAEAVSRSPRDPR